MEATVPPAATHVVPNTIAGLRILRGLGEGGMAQVVLAYDAARDRRLAVKLLHPELADRPDHVERFRREAWAGERLHHPNLIRGEGAGFDAAAGLHYMLQEYVDGPTCQQILDKSGPLAVADAVHIALGVARALECLHRRRLVHRDLKPGNVLLGCTGAVKLADLGLVKDLAGANDLTGHDQAFGTTHYMPYEQTRNASFVDGRSDLFALGATLYHLLTGELPFPGETYREVSDRKLKGPPPPASRVRPGVPVALDPILARLMAFDPAARYRSASDLIVVLERTGLAGSLLSFVDPEWAARSARPGETAVAGGPATVPDLKANPDGTGKTSPGALWAVKVPGAAAPRRLSTNQVLHGMREQAWPAGTVAAPFGDKRFRPLGEYPDFAPAPVPSSAGKPSAAAKTSPIRATCLAGLALVYAATAGFLACLFGSH